MALNGVFLPIVTPFKDGEVDYNTYQSLIEHYLSCGISGIIPLGTTGEVPVLTDPEQEKIIDITVETVNSRVPILVGLGGNCTDHVIKRLTLVHKYPVDGILSVCPYYNRPGQKGLLSHFTKLSKATDLDILIYNIPYRTGVNMANDTLLKLAELKNIQGVKDSCGDIGQSLKLIADKPDNFSVLTGEDIMFFTNIAHGGDGGILASAHLGTQYFINAFHALKENDFTAALSNWKKVQTFIPWLFAEPNPAPLKQCLFNKGRIESPEVRLPLTGVSNSLKQTLESIQE